MRGCTQADVTVRGSHKFRFVNTHLEAFGDPTIRRDQARELVQPGGPATGQLPVILLGDLNSDDDTVQNSDRLAYKVFSDHGFRERSTANQLGCRLNADIITQGAAAASPTSTTRSIHVLTNAHAALVTLQNSSVTATARERLLGPDHAGLFSTLLRALSAAGAGSASRRAEVDGASSSLSAFGAEPARRSVQTASGSRAR